MTTLNSAQYRAFDVAARRGDTHITSADCDTYTMYTIAGLGLGVLEFDHPDAPASALRLNPDALLAWSDETDRRNQSDETVWHIPCCSHGCIAGDVCPDCGPVAAVGLAA